MKGRRKLNINKFNTYPPRVDVSRIQSRNRKLAARYYYYARLHRLNYEVIVTDLLPEEFDLATRTIIDALSDNHAHIMHFQQQQYGIAELRKEYPYLAWKEAQQLSLFN